MKVVAEIYDTPKDGSTTDVLFENAGFSVSDSGALIVTQSDMLDKLTKITAYADGEWRKAEATPEGLPKLVQAHRN